MSINIIIQMLSQFPQATNHYVNSIPTSSYSPYFGHGNLVPALIGPDQSASVSPIGHTVPQSVQMTHQKIYRPAERLEVSLCLKKYETLTLFCYENLGHNYLYEVNILVG